MTHHIILGGGPAGISAIETIRQLDGGSSRISLISAEPAHDRGLLPRWLAGQITKQQVLTGDDAYFAGLKVDRYIGQPATRINPTARTVTIKGGQMLPFDDLLIATGCSAVMPPIPGADLPGVQPFWTIAHVEAVLQAAGNQPKPDVVVIGAGFVGLIALNALHQRGWPLQVVEAASQVLPRALDAEGASLVAEWLRQKGIGLHCGVTVQEIQAAGERKQVVLAGGVALEADIVIIAAGSKANLVLAKAAGIPTAAGILVNERMQTSYPHIYAAGDVAQGPDLSGDRPAVHANHATAVAHGRVAGANMAGEDACYSGSLFENVLDCRGLSCALAGGLR